MKCFVDTNVLLYAKDTSAPSKQTQAQTWLSALNARDAAVLSAQSLREYYNNALRQDRSAPAVLALRRELIVLDALVPDTLRIDRMAEAWALQDRHRLSFWDGMLMASALAAGCSVYLSEDMNAGQKVETLRIVNPFQTAPEDLLGA
jgi:predicted nucleic acid-binding protein